MVHNVFSKVLKKGICSKAYVTVRSKKIKAWLQEFPELDENENYLNQIVLTSTAKKEISKELKEFFLEKKRLQGFRAFHTFMGWWKNKQDVYLSLPVLQNAVERDLTVGDFVDELQLAFLEAHYGQKQMTSISKFFHRTMQNPLLFGISISAVFLLHRAIGFAWGLMILGPGVQMINSYSQPVITPMAQTAAQTGAKDLAKAASFIQEWLSNRKALQAVNADLHATTQDLSKIKFSELDREETKKQWAHFEKTYFELFQRLNQALPSHLRDGRSFYRDWMVITPITLASHLSTFDTQYWVHKRELLELRKASRRRALASAEKALVKVHEEQMAAIEDRMSGTLAAWKLYEFMFPEFAQEAMRHTSPHNLLSTYNILVESLHFDLYVKNFSGKVTELLKQMDAQFLMHDIQLDSKEAQGAPGERRTPIKAQLDAANVRPHAEVASISGTLKPRSFLQSLSDAVLPKMGILRR